MLCICPAELRTLRIANGKVTGYVKNQGQEDISRVFRSMEKDEERASNDYDSKLPKESLQAVPTK